MIPLDMTRLCGAFCMAAVASVSTDARAFPPYRSTDAATADPYDLELRLGLLKVNRKDGESEVLSPLLRVNYGLPRGFELTSELEYSHTDDRFADGAIGAKWASPEGRLRFGVETLALLPVNGESSGVGIESQALATWSQGDYRVHLNAGGFHDPRGGEPEHGWRASMLAELKRGPARFGAELFAKDSNLGRTDVRAGVGVIHRLGDFDIRSGVHLGLTPEAPDVSASIWIATKFATR